MLIWKIWKLKVRSIISDHKLSLSLEEALGLLPEFFYEQKQLDRWWGPNPKWRHEWLDQGRGLQTGSKVWDPHGRSEETTLKWEERRQFYPKEQGGLDLRFQSNIYQPGNNRNEKLDSKDDFRMAFQLWLTWIRPSTQANSSASQGVGSYVSSVVFVAHSKNFGQ